MYEEANEVLDYISNIVEVRQVGKAAAIGAVTGAVAGLFRAATGMDPSYDAGLTDLSHIIGFGVLGGATLGGALEFAAPSEQVYADRFRKRHGKCPPKFRYSRMRTRCIAKQPLF